MFVLLVEKRLSKTSKCGTRSTTTSSEASKLSTASIQGIIEKLKSRQNRSSTMKTYLSVWRQFNKFVIRLDVKPNSWEERASLFAAHIVDRGMQSQTVKSYMSAIKKTLITDGYNWEDNNVLLTTLTRACKLINDKVRTRLPIRCPLLELILFEIQRKFNQKYLIIMYQALYILGYYGMMRVGELTYTPHVLRAKDVHMGVNKDKLMLVLYSSKTHDFSSRPQKIKITSNKERQLENKFNRNFCPFETVHKYISCRSDIEKDNEPFFIFRDGSPVTAVQARELLRTLLTNLGLDCSLYDMHSLRIGRTSDLVSFGYRISEVKAQGRWRSSAVYRYIRV